MRNLYNVLLMALALTLGALTTRAQAPAWNLATRLGPNNNVAGARTVNRVVADAQGNLIVAGFFQGQFTLGSTTLVSAGGLDLFVAKYVPATDTWAWAYRGGGAGFDALSDVVVSGSTIYVVGFVEGSITSVNNVQLAHAGGNVRVLGATATASYDMLLARYTDNGTSATLNWTQVGGGTGVDYANRVAVSGTSVYVVGNYTNNQANARLVVLGGSGASTAPGTVPLRGIGPNNGYDVVLAKYTDQGTAGVLRWAQVAGSPQDDDGLGVAVQGSAVYLTGSVAGSSTSAGAATLGGDGTTPGGARQYGATSTSSNDILLARYTDNGLTATFNWSQVAGGTSYDTPQDLAVSGTSVYVLGTVINNAADANTVLLGGSGPTPGTRPQPGAGAAVSRDILVAKYTDLGTSATLGWSQVGGGTADDDALDLALNGRNVYLVGTARNNAANTNAVTFGGVGPVAGTVSVPGATSTLSNDLLLARYQDNGSTAALAWVQVGGSPSNDTGNALALSGSSVYTVSYGSLPATYGPLTVTGAAGEPSLVLARLTDTVLPTRPSAAGAGSLALYPNPTGGAARLSGVAPGAAVQVLDALGRVVASATADAAGTAPVGAGLGPGVYLVRSGVATARLSVQ